MLLDIDPVIPMAAVRVGDWKLITGVPCITKPKNANCGWYTPPSEAKDLLDVKYVFLPRVSMSHTQPT